MTREQKLVDAILQDGRKEASKLIKKAEKQAQQILEEKEKEEQNFFDQQIANLKEEQSAEIAIQKQSQTLRKNKVVLVAKNEVLEKVFELALSKLLEMPQKTYVSFLEKALSNAGIGNEILVASEKDKKLISKLNAFKSKKLKILPEFGKFSGGVVIVSKTKEMDFSFESLLAEKFEKNKFEIAKQLF